MQCYWDAGRFTRPSFSDCDINSILKHRVASVASCRVLYKEFSQKHGSRKFSRTEKMVGMKGSFRSCRKLFDPLPTIPKYTCFCDKTQNVF